MNRPLIATLESGGTKMVAGLASGPDDIRLRERIPTTTPKETISALVRFFQKATREHGAVEALGVGTFGPADLNMRSEQFGYITRTPKAGWSFTDLLGPLREALGDIPAAFETDVNASLFGEVRWGAARGERNAAYFTVGTGIGGGLMLNGELVHGTGHPEMGHMGVCVDSKKDPFEGVCPFHGHCLEGMASGPALEKRWGRPGHELPPKHPAWELQADYLAQACRNLLTIAPPDIIILGGGVMKQEQLFPLIREKVTEYLGGYLTYPAWEDDLSESIVPPALGDDAGLLGCVALGQDLLARNNQSRSATAPTTSVRNAR